MQASSSNSGPKPASTKPLRVVKPRAAARPHKKLSSEILKTRTAETKKRLLVLQSKSVLMEDRLGAYMRETEIRDNEAN